MLPVLWIVLALQSTWFRATFRSATLEWIRKGGRRRSKGNLAASLWAAAAALCFPYEAFAQALALASILFGWQATDRVAASFLLVALILTIGISTWVLLLQVAARVDVEPDRKQ